MSVSSAGPVRIQVLHPEDLMSPTIGGIATFLRDFVRLAPPDIEIEVIGATGDTNERPVGRWQSWEIGPRTIRFLPLIPSAPADRLSRFPVSLRFTLALAARREGRSDPSRTLQFHRPEVPLAFLRHRAPRVLIVHIDVKGGPQATRWRRIRGVYRMVENATIPSADRVFVANHVGVRLYRERYPESAERIQFLSGWYNDAIFAPLGVADRVIERRRAMRDLGLPAEAATDRLILFAARLEIEKDPTLAVNAFASLQAHEPAARLVVLGEGSERVTMEQHAAALGVGARVHFLGARSQDVVGRLMQVADVLLVTSHSEGGGPRVVVEALACGLPVVSTRVGEVQSVVRDGRNGQLAHDRSPQTVAEALQSVLALPHEQVSAAAVVAAGPFAAALVLETLYDAHRALADRSGRT